MATTQNGTYVTLTAGADLSDKQYYFMSLASDGQVDPTGDGAIAVGIQDDDNATAAGHAVRVGIGGILKVKCGGTVTAGGPVASDANGLAVDATSGDEILGTAIEGGALNQIISIVFHPRGSL